LDVFEFRAITHRDHFIRHRNFLGELTRKEGPPDDFHFALVPRGQQNLVALRSKNFPRLFLRHRDFRVRLEGPSGSGDQQFARDAAFFMVPGLADPNGVSFQSFNFRDRFLRHRDFQLFVEPMDGPGAQRDATFIKQRPAVIIDHGPELVPADD
jgi:Alpha-L-arabinofuranosidase B (ABFB) domain